MNNFYNFAKSYKVLYEKQHLAHVNFLRGGGRKKKIEEANFFSNLRGGEKFVEKSWGGDFFALFERGSQMFFCFFSKKLSAKMLPPLP